MCLRADPCSPDSVEAGTNPDAAFGLMLTTAACDASVDVDRIEHC